MHSRFSAELARVLGLEPASARLQPVGGGDIASAFVIGEGDRSAFIKTLPMVEADLLAAEIDGLEAIAATGAVRVPEVLGHGLIDQTAWLALEFLPLAPRGRLADERLGRRLARMYRVEQKQFGWHRDNFIGRTGQRNTPGSNWTEFFLDQRLDVQFELLAAGPDGGIWPELAGRVAVAWRERFGDHQPAPALVHGDLWQGNAAAIADDQPVIFDPAVHVADRECDLAMTRLFGGFSEAFYQAYETEWPLPAGHDGRRDFYLLYHLLNHANLFAGGYLERSISLCRRITAWH